VKEDEMALLLPEADGVAGYVAGALPGERVIRYGETASCGLDDITFYCLPYMGDAASVELIARLPSLTVVQSLSSGVDDVLGAIPPQVTLCNGRGLGHEEGTAELALALILASLRGIGHFAREQGERRWSHQRTRTLEGRRVLLVGYGPIGAALERRLLPFGASVSRASRTPAEGVHALADLPELAASADILVTCIALHESTRGLISKRVLAAMPDGALVVNVARGPVVDAAALTGELTSGRLSAALDVTDPEPLPAGRPEWDLPNVLITPHIGGDTDAFARRAADFVAAQAGKHLAGRPLENVVRAAQG
jgi:phosphoglycerate dehydrogenase-like enzyme